MKLAEALLERSDAEKKFESLKNRISRNAVVQEGDKPHEDPNKLMKEAVGVLNMIEKLVARINAANLRSKLPDGRTLTEALAHRDKLAEQHAVINAAIEGSQNEQARYGMSEIKWVATVDVAKLQKQLEDIAKQIREINARIQEANWQVEV